MKQLLLALALLFTIQSFSQDYIPMLQEGNNWSVDVYHDIFDCQQEPCIFTITHQLSLGNTELHNETEYVRIIVDEEETCLLREQNGLVFKYDVNSNQENVLFDFNLEIGDTFNLDESAYSAWDGCVTEITVYYDPILTVASVAYLSLAGQTRKVITFEETTGPNSQGSFQWIEGIGNITGFDLLAEFVDITSGSALVCFTNDENSYFFNGATACDNTTLGNSEIINDTEALLYPNPVSDIATLTLPLEINKAKILFLNINGKIIYEQHISEKDTALDFSALHSGMYFYQIYSENELILSKKLIIK